MTASDSLLSEEYDVLLIDLDGTVYRGANVIPGARDALANADATQYFVTNNASRSPEAVAAHLLALGIEVTPDAVVTSAQAGARLVAGTVPEGGRVLVVGASALEDEVRSTGLTPVRDFEPGVAAVVQGFAPEVGWRDLAEAALAIRAGGWWVATNVDTTLPSERGLLPGNGSLVAALATATGAQPSVAGKPCRPIMDDAVRISGASRPLVVGDRLDTDIAGACAAELDSLLVLTGVSTAAEMIRADAGSRPTHVAADLAGLAAPAAVTVVGPQDGWSATVDGETMYISCDAADDCAADVDGTLTMAGLRAVAAAAWERDFDGEIVGTDSITARLAAAWNPR